MKSDSTRKPADLPATPNQCRRPRLSDFTLTGARGILFSRGEADHWFVLPPKRIEAGDVLAMLFAGAIVLAFALIAIL